MTLHTAWIREDLSEARLLTGAGEAVWRAPATPPDAEIDAFALRDRASQAAHWVATQLGADKRLAVLIVDVEDAACVFASAPSADPEVVAAAMRASAVNYDALAMRGTMQPLARAAGKPRALSSPTIERFLKRNKPDADGAQPGASVRTAVLASPDSLVRIFLDQLDRRSVSVGVAQSLWHSMVSAWGPSGADAPGGEDADASVEARDIGALEAVILEDSGRLLWSWSRRGSLVAAGELSVRRAGFDGPGGAGGQGAQWNSEDWFPVAASRLALDWLTWSTHLGQSPTRVRVVGADAKDLSRTLEERWPDLTVDATTQNDPIGATLRAFAQREERSLPADDDPTRTLVSLSRRRGRAHATLYTWSGVATGLLAVAIFAVGWRALEKRTRLTEAAAQVQSASAIRVEEVAPELRNNPDRARALESELQRLRKDRPQITDPAPARPVLDEIERLLGALNELGPEGLFFTDFHLNETLPNATVRLPNFETGERLREILRRTPGQIDWNVQFVREIGQNIQDWKLTGQWARTESAR
ncbi:MAG: hypothetical protein KF684_04570 [Phycisphaeraceae bacterium]|nr:hypothetical protein [Phycisphaeraceae bacterium]